MSRLRMTPQLRRALEAWGRWYSARLDRITAGSKEDYTGHEQDLFEAIGCRGMPEPKLADIALARNLKERADATRRAFGHAPLKSKRKLRKDVGTTYENVRRRAEIRTKRERRGAIREQVFARATAGQGYARCEGPVDSDPSKDGRCSRTATELLHVFGRGKGRMPESERNCLAACSTCHRTETRNHPSSSAWWRFFAAFFRRLGFDHESRAAIARAEFDETRAALPAAPKLREST